MTREEQIEQAAIEYATHWTDTKETDFYGKFIQEMSCNPEEERAFIAGARWAVANLKSPWISVKEKLPCDEKDLVIEFIKEVELRTKKVVVLLEDGFIDITYMYSFPTHGWHWNINDVITHWFPIPELQKK